MITVRKYGRRHHAVYDGEELLAVCAYKIGAREVKRRIDDLEDRLAESQRTWPAAIAETAPTDAMPSSTTEEPQP